MTHTLFWSTTDSLLPTRFPVDVDHPFTAAEALRRGGSRRQLRRLVDEGYLRRVLRGVYVAAQVPDDLRMRTEAVSLVIPPRAVVTDRTAAWLHGVAILPRTSPVRPPPIEVFRTDDVRVQRSGVAGGRRGLLQRDVVIVHGVHVTTPLRTACDLGRLLWRFDALAALDGFLRVGVEHDALLAELRRFKGYRGVRQLRPLAAIADPGSESPAESALRLHWYDAGLPMPTLQHWIDDEGVPRFRFDLALPELRYAAEYDGVEHHSRTDDVAHDTERRDWARERGWHIDVFENADVYGFRVSAPDRLRRGVETARKALAPWHPGDMTPR